MYAIMDRRGGSNKHSLGVPDPMLRDRIFCFMQQRTLGQQVAEAEAKLAGLRNQSRELENGRKTILGKEATAAGNGQG